MVKRHLNRLQKRLRSIGEGLGLVRVCEVHEEVELWIMGETRRNFLGRCRDDLCAYRIRQTALGGAWSSRKRHWEWGR